MTEIDQPPAFPLLPPTLPVFPLTGAVLLPRGVMPLNIFEPRYLAMVRDAIAAAGAGAGLIGMIQPRGTGSDALPQLYDIGCVGRIAEHRDTDDGRMLIELTGLLRFRVIRELDVTTPYRQVVADYDAYAADLGEPAPVNAGARAALEDSLRSYLDANDLSADWEAIARADDDSLITTLATVCPFDPVEKQALLEAADLPARAATITALMTFSAGFGGEPGRAQ